MGQQHVPNTFRSVSLVGPSASVVVVVVVVVEVVVGGMVVVLMVVGGRGGGVKAEDREASVSSTKR